MTGTDLEMRCSAWAREVDLSPIATIGCYAGYLLVETPLPWPRDVGEIPEMAGLIGRLQDRNIRLQALVPKAPSAGQSERRMVLHAKTDETWFSGYRRIETRIGKSPWEALDGLLSAERSVTRDGDVGDVDLLVCTHGRRDVCCGSQGTDLALQLAAAGGPPGRNLWRTSHTGGHRFAPTFVVLPQGTAWAFADPTLVESVLERSVPFADVAGRYRGCSGLQGPQAQALEREVLMSVGWQLFDRKRAVYATGETSGNGRQVFRLDAGSDHWEGLVAPGRSLPVPDCMKPLSQATKFETEWKVYDVRSVN